MKAMVIVFAAMVAGCAYTTVKPIEYGDKARGFRVYDPQPVLISNCDSTSVTFVPNFSRGYAVQPRAWLAKNKSSVKVSNGMLDEGSADIDTTALLSLIQGIGTEAIKGVDKLAALSTATGSLPQAGVWTFEYDQWGRLTGLRPLVDPTPCPPKPGLVGGGAPPVGAGKPKPGNGHGS